MADDIIGEVSIAVRNLILQSHEVNSCIESTRLGLLVFERLGIRARPQPVKVAVMNRESWTLMQRGVPIAQWPKKAWNLGVGFREGGDHPEGWNGHLVAVVRQSGEPRYVVDISADQFHRPGRLEVPGPVQMAITGPWSPVDPMYRILRDNSTILDYRPFSPNDPVGTEYKVAPAWTKDPEWFAAAAEHIVKNLG